MGPRKKIKPNRAQTKHEEPLRTQGTVEEKLTVLDWHHKNGDNQSATAEHFSNLPGFRRLDQSTVGRWLKIEQELRHELEKGNAQSIRSRSVKHPELEECLRAWVDRMEETHASRITDDVIKEVASRFYDQLKVPVEERVTLSNGWLDKFKQRQGLQLQKFHGEAASAPVEMIEPEQQRVAALISGFLAEGTARTLDGVWNADETSFFYACVPDQGLARAKRSGVKQSRTRLTLCLAINATGTERLSPLFTGNSASLGASRRRLILPHRRENVRGGTLAAPALDELQATLTQLSARAAQKCHPLDLMDATEFVDHYHSSVGFELCMLKIFEDVAALSISSEQSVGPSKLKTI